MKQLLRTTTGLAFAAVTFFSLSLFAELNVGDAAPAFELKGSDGKTYKLADLTGKAVVVAWYPKAFTGG